MPQTETGISLELTHTFDAPREKVFDAWIDPQVLLKWFASAPTWDTPLAETDPRVGGNYRLSMRNADNGEIYTMAGEYTEVRRPERLAYTMSWEGQEMAGSENSIVTIDFLEDGGKTKVVLRHTGFANEELRDMHTQGWQGCLANLESRVFS